MRFEILLFIPITALFGCGEPTYEECVREAVEDGRSEYGIQVLTELCDRVEKRKQEQAAIDSGAHYPEATTEAVDAATEATEATDVESEANMERIFYEATGLDKK